LGVRDLRLTANGRSGKIHVMSDNKPPPKPMLACRDFEKKLRPYLAARAEAQGDLCRRLGIPGNKITRWRDGHQVFIDHAWLVVRALGLESLWDYLLDDRQKEPPIVDPARERILAMVKRLGTELAEQRLLAAPKRGRPTSVKRPAKDPDPASSAVKRSKRRTKR
jgi:hypothetical protein